jgi:hypothetical protein
MKGLLDRVDNRRTTHGSQNDTLKWVCGNRNNAYYCSVVMLHGLYISGRGKGEAARRVEVSDCGGER